GVLAVRVCARVKVFIRNLRRKQRSRPRNETVLRGYLIASLVKVCRRRLRVKRVQTEIVKFLRKNRGRQSRRLAIVNLQVELREGVKALEFGIALQRRKALHRRANKSVFKGLGKCQTVLN